MIDSSSTGFVGFDGSTCGCGWVGASAAAPQTSRLVSRLVGAGEAAAAEGRRPRARPRRRAWRARAKDTALLTRPSISAPEKFFVRVARSRRSTSGLWLGWREWGDSRGYHQKDGLARVWEEEGEGARLG